MRRIRSIQLPVILPPKISSRRMWVCVCFADENEGDMKEEKRERGMLENEEPDGNEENRKIGKVGRK